MDNLYDTIMLYLFRNDLEGLILELDYLDLNFCKSEIEYMFTSGYNAYEIYEYIENENSDF